MWRSCWKETLVTGLHSSSEKCVKQLLKGLMHWKKATSKCVPDQYKILKTCEENIERMLHIWKYASDQFKTFKMCEEAFERMLFPFKYVCTTQNSQNMRSICYKDAILIGICFWSVYTHKMCKKLFKIIYCHRNLFLVSIRHKKCLIKPLKSVLDHWNLFLIGIRHRKCVIKQLKRNLGYWNMSLMSINPEKCVNKLLKRSHLYWSVLFSGWQSLWCLRRIKDVLTNRL